MEAAQIHIGIDARDDARLAELPDGVLAFPVDFGRLIGVAPDVQVMLVEMRGKVLVIELHRAVNHGLHAIMVLNQVTEFVHAVDELAA